MFRNLRRLMKENNRIDIETNLDITKPGDIGKIILYDNDLYVYNGSNWILFTGQKNYINILQFPIPFEGLNYDNTINNIKYYKKPFLSKPWAGVTFFKSDINIITPDIHKISIYVISPKDNVTIMLKIENKVNPNMFQEVKSVLPNKNILTRLTFDFDGNTGNTYDMVSVFFDFLQNGDNSVYGLGNYIIH